MMWSREENTNNPWIDNPLAGIIPRILRVKPIGGGGGGVFCVFLSLPTLQFMGTDRFPSLDVGAGVESVALEELEDTVVV